MIALLCLTLLAFFIDASMVAHTGSIDYRNRVTGMRLLADGADPYHTKWQSGGPERLLDVYENPQVPVTKTTVSPATLVAGWAFAALPYGPSKLLWMLAQWAMLAAIWWMWLRWPALDARARWWWTILIVGFSHTLPWRHHVDHGQGYLLWAFLLSSWARLSLARPNPKNSHLAGFLAGLMICLRPPLLMVVAPVLCFRRRQQWLGAACGLLLGLGAPMLLRPSIWQDYARAMSHWSEMYRHQTEPRPGARAYPATIEGIPTAEMARYEVVQFVDSSLYRFLRYGGWTNLSDKILLAALCLLYGFWLLLARKIPDAAGMAGLMAWVFLADAFLPAYRYPYADVMILTCLAMLPALRQPIARRLSQPLALAAILCAAAMLLLHPPDKRWIHLPNLALALVALFTLTAALLPAKAQSAPSPP